VVYGTSSFSGAPRSTEFDIDPVVHAAAYVQAGLSKPTRFNLLKAVVVNYDDMYFGLAPNGNRSPETTPKLGTLHASRYRALREAHSVVVEMGQRRR